MLNATFIYSVRCVKILKCYDFRYVSITVFPDNKLTQNKGQINVKRELNSAAKPWTQFNSISPLKLTLKLLMLIFTAIVYSLRYYAPITEY